MGIFIIIAGLLIIIAIIYFILMKKKAATPTPEPANNQTPTGQLATSSDIGTTTPGDKPRTGNYDVSKEAPHKTNANDLGKISMSFAERLGSYSSQSNYSNFNDLKVYGVTDNLQTWIDKYVADLKSQAKNGSNYYGIATDALTFSVSKFDEAAGKAEIVVSTQRRESTEEINGGKAYVQKLTLSLVKVNNEWLFDKAVWGKK